jgi:hypothetical protein
MPGKSMTPEQLTEAVTLRAAGLSLVGIAERVGVSVSTLQRAFKRHRMRKGTIKPELVAAAKKELIERVTSDQRIREEAARLIGDDIAHTVMLRDKMAIAAEQFKATNLSEAVLLMRACAAYSVALKNTSDTVRHVMRFDKAVAEPPENLPELLIRVISDKEAAQLGKSSAVALDAPDNNHVDVIEQSRDDDDDRIVIDS